MNVQKKTTILRELLVFDQVTCSKISSMTSQAVKMSWECVNRKEDMRERKVERKQLSVVGHLNKQRYPSQFFRSFSLRFSSSANQWSLVVDHLCRGRLQQDIVTNCRPEEFVSDTWVNYRVQSSVISFKLSQNHTSHVWTFIRSEIERRRMRAKGSVDRIEWAFSSGDVWSNFAVLCWLVCHLRGTDKRVKIDVDDEEAFD